MQTLDVMKAAAICLERLKARGFEVEQSADFTRVTAQIAGMEKNYLTPKLSPDWNDFTSESAIWLFLLRGGKPVGGVGARFDALGPERVDTYWQRTFARQYPRPKGPTVEDVSPVLVERLTGNLVYVGDFFLAQDVRGPAAVSKLMAYLMLALALSKWPNLDWVYAFIRQRDLGRGAAARYGLHQVVPRPLNWPDPPEGRGNTEWFAGTTRDELQHMFRNFDFLSQEL